MKIAVWHNLNSGGGKRALYNHVKGLIERGHYVISYVPDTIDQEFLPLSTLVEEKVFPLKDKIAKRTSRFKRLHSVDLVFERSEAMLEHCEECGADIMQGGFDILFANSTTDFYMSHIGRYVTIPKIIYLGEPYRKVYEAFPEFLWKAPMLSGRLLSDFKQRLLHLYKMYCYSYICREEYISAKSYDAILVNSIYSRECVMRSYKIEAKVCYLGIDTGKFTSVVNKKQQYVVGLGLVTKAKGIERAIDSIAAINEDIRPPLVWIGNNKIKDSAYIKYIEDYALQNSVNLQLKLNISDGELFSTLGAASVLLYLPNLEPFGLAPLEANACGTAVIGIREGGLKETIYDNVNGFSIMDYSPAKVASYIEMFLNPDYAIAFGQKSKDYVLDNWSLEKGTDNIEGVMKSLLKIK